MFRWMGIHLMMEDTEEEDMVIVKSYRELAGNWWILLPFVIRFSLDLHFPSLFCVHFQHFIYWFVPLFSQQILVIEARESTVYQCLAMWALLFRDGQEILSKWVNLKQWVCKENEERKGPWLMSSSIFLDRGIAVGLVEGWEQVRDSLHGCELGKRTMARST